MTTDRLQRRKAGLVRAEPRGQHRYCHAAESRTRRAPEQHRHDVKGEFVELTAAEGLTDGRRSASHVDIPFARLARHGQRLLENPP